MAASSMWLLLLLSLIFHLTLSSDTRVLRRLSKEQGRQTTNKDWEKSKETCRQKMTLDSCTHQKHVICMQGNARITVPLTWEEAHNHCKKNHSGLLYIRDEDDQQEVKTWLNVPKSPGPFWIGLRQSRLFGFWIWSTIDQVVEYHNWKGGSPPEVPLSHHCGVLEAGTGKWRDEDCNTRLPALCLEDMYP